MNEASQVFGVGTQVISQLRSNQIIRSNGHEKKISTYFNSYPSVFKNIAIRVVNRKQVILLAPSGKQLSNRTPIRLESTDSLKYRRAS